MSQGGGSQGSGGSNNNNNNSHHNSGLQPLGAYAGGSGPGATQEGQGLGLAVTGSTPTTFNQAKGQGPVLAHGSNGSSGTRKTTAPSSSSGPSLAALNNGSRKTVAMGGGRDRVPVAMNTISFGVQGNGSNGGTGGGGGGGGSMNPNQPTQSTVGVGIGITPFHPLTLDTQPLQPTNGQGDSSEKEEILTQEQYLQGSPSREEIELAVGRMDHQAMFCDSLR